MPTANMEFSSGACDKTIALLIPLFSTGIMLWPLFPGGRDIGPNGSVVWIMGFGYITVLSANYFLQRFCSTWRVYESDLSIRRPFMDRRIEFRDILAHHFFGETLLIRLNNGRRFVADLPRPRTSELIDLLDRQIEAGWSSDTERPLFVTSWFCPFTLLLWIVYRDSLVIELPWKTLHIPFANVAAHRSTRHRLMLYLKDGGFRAFFLPKHKRDELRAVLKEWLAVTHTP